LRIRTMNTCTLILANSSPLFVVLISAIRWRFREIFAKGTISWSKRWRRREWSSRHWCDRSSRNATALVRVVGLIVSARVRSRLIGFPFKGEAKKLFNITTTCSSTRLDFKGRFFVRKWLAADLACGRVFGMSYLQRGIERQEEKDLEHVHVETSDV
jgi:hypothetical protein